MMQIVNNFFIVWGYEANVQSDQQKEARSLAKSNVCKYRKQEVHVFLGCMERPEQPDQPEQAKIWKNGKYNKWTTCKLMFHLSVANENTNAM